MRSNRVLVVGDPINDIYLDHESLRDSPEAPGVPVLLQKSRQEVPGGALNVVTNINAMGGQAQLLGYNRPVTKTRIMLEGKQICRIDEHSRDPHSAVEDQGLLNIVRQILTEKKHDALVISDYNLGVSNIAQETIRIAIDLKVPVLVDPKQKNWNLYYRGATLIKPNMKEWMGAKRTEIPFILVTDAENAAHLRIHRDDLWMYFPVPQTSAVDPCGCGDVVIATLARWWGQMDIIELTKLAMKAGAVAVSKKGTAVVFEDEVVGEEVTC